MSDDTFVTLFCFLVIGLATWSANLSDRVGGQLVVFTVQCKLNVASRCDEKMKPGYRFIYTPVRELQTVAVRATSIEGQVTYSKFTDCVVVDRTNWRCKLGDDLAIEAVDSDVTFVGAENVIGEVWKGVWWLRRVF